MDIQLGYWRWKIYRWNEHPNPFRGRHDLAIEWLRRFSGNGTAMPEWRSLLERSGLGASRPDDQQVLEEVAARLSSGEFYVCAESSHPFHTPEANVVPPDANAAATEALAAMTQAPPPAAAAAAAAASPAAGPAPGGDTPPSPLAQPSQETTLSQNANAAAIADSLADAAKTGSALVEECTMPDAVEAAKPASGGSATSTTTATTSNGSSSTLSDSGSTFSDSVDATATAAGMKQAAEEGAPFCEEYEKTKGPRAALGAS